MTQDQVIVCRSTGVRYQYQGSRTINRKTKLMAFKALNKGKHTKDFQTTQEALEKALQTKVFILDDTPGVKAQDKGIENG